MKSKTLLDIEIDRCYDRWHKMTETRWYDYGARDVYFEGYVKGLEKAKRLVNKQYKLSGLQPKRNEL